MKLGTDRKDDPFYHSVNVYKAKMEPLLAAFVTHRPRLTRQFEVFSFLLSTWGYFAIINRNLLFGVFFILNAATTSFAKDLGNRELGRRIL